MPRTRSKTARRRPLTEEERDGMRRAGQVNAELMDYLRPYVEPGVTTGHLDKLAYDWILQRGHVPACLGYQGFPKSICTSINEVVCHGIPGYRTLKDGDIINVDLTTIVHGKQKTDTWHGDQSETFLIGEVSDEARKLVQCTFECLWLGIRALYPGCPVNEVGKAIQKHAHAQGYSVVEDYLGHGIGREFHEEPVVPHYPHRKFQSVILHPGMCFTVEPMINIGTLKSKLDRNDGWTVRTEDGELSAQFEHTILMTEDGPEILTLTKDGPQEGHVF